MALKKERELALCAKNQWDYCQSEEYEYVLVG